jgi:putative ABC transport system permease protein
MLRNYLKTAFRSLVRNRNYTIINITGMAIGIAVCMMIFMIIRFHNSFDDFHTKKDRIYRVLTEYHHSAADSFYGKEVPYGVPEGLKTAFPQIEQLTPVYTSKNDQLLIPGQDGNTEKIFKEQKGVFFAEPSFFKIFDYPLLAGAYESLQHPNNVLLTKETAEKYFGNWKAAMGRTINLEAGGFMFEHGTEPLKVSGILASIPANTDLQLKMVVAYRTGFTGSIMAASTDWNSTEDNFGCYILLPKHVDVNNFNQQLKAFSRKMAAPGNKNSHIIQPISEAHYDTKTGNYSNRTISHQLLNVLWLIAAFILLIACVNFINLTTAQAVTRAKEVGVRKVLGGNKIQLQAQFIAETLLIVIGAVILAAVATRLALPFINQLLELSLSFNALTNPALIVFLSTVTIGVTLLAGFYPSLFLSRFNPILALKTRLNTHSSKGISLRRGLVVFNSS